MKKVLYIASMCLAMAFTSCDDFLTVSSPDKLTTGNFWRDQKDAEATLASAYAQLYHGDSYATSEVRWPVEAYRTDLYDIGNDEQLPNLDRHLQLHLYQRKYTVLLLLPRPLPGYQLHQSGIGVRTQNLRAGNETVYV